MYNNNNKTQLTVRFNRHAVAVRVVAIKRVNTIIVAVADERRLEVKAPIRDKAHDRGRRCRVTVVAAVAVVLVQDGRGESQNLPRTQGLALGNGTVDAVAATAAAAVHHFVQDHFMHCDKAVSKLDRSQQINVQFLRLTMFLSLLVLHRGNEAVHELPGVDLNLNKDVEDGKDGMLQRHETGVPVRSARGAGSRDRLRSDRRRSKRRT